jgi:rhamnulokinase/L-fuculokinase
MKVLAFDLGASSGRAILGIYENGKLQMEEIHRFSNDPVSVNGTLYWDILRLFYEIKTGLLKCVNAGHKDIESIAIDTWGVDFGLLDADGRLLENPVHYRDARCDGMMEKVFEKVPKENIYASTGIQFVKLNTIFQLASLVENRKELLERAKTLLFTPDLLAYFLTGKMSVEYTIASTSQLLNAEKRDWDFELIEKLGIKKSIFPPIRMPGTVTGSLLPEIAQEVGFDRPVDVIACASHDTASAVVAAPIGKGEKSCYISCGTWSLLGAELDSPLINSSSFEENFTNEGGYAETIRFLKNISGLWLIQETRRQWNREGNDISFKDIDRMLETEVSANVYINPDDDSFSAPGNMPKRIEDYLTATNQPLPSTKGQQALCILESLALTYRFYIENLEKLLGEKIDTVHLIGGGTKDENLCRFTACATKKRVTAGPVEATAIGNIAVQLIAKGVIKDLDEARTLLGDVKEYLPKDTDLWEKKYADYMKVR